MQTKKESHKEIQVNTILGILVGLIAMRIMLPIIENLDKNIQSIIVVFVMFVLSYSRGYLVRRYFNKRLINE